MAGTKQGNPSAEVKTRLLKCRREMKKHRVAAYLVSSRNDHRYLTGFDGEDSAVLITPREVHLITDGRFDESARREAPWAKKWLRNGMLIDEIASVAKQLRLRSLAVQHDKVTVKDHAALKKRARGIRLTEAPPIAQTMRKFKSSSELRLVQKALRIAEDAFRETVRSIRIGMTELEIAAKLEYEMKRRGATGLAFPTICAEGPNAALPHARPGKRKVRRGSALLIDWGARVEGYCSDLTRVIFIDSIPPKLREVYNIVLNAQTRAIRALRPGRRMCDVDAEARGCIDRAGYGKAFNHGLGHGFGLDVHEPPSLSWRSDEKLAPGMVVTVEPGIYLPGIGGVRIEDDVLVTKTGARVLSRLGKRLEDATVRVKG
jgi:Xaa-Pro aminopeptidase